MHITILTAGTRGDVQPYIALGLGFKEAGYTVRIGTYEVFKDYVEGYGFEFYPLKGDPFVMLKTKEGKKLLSSGKSPFKFITQFKRLHLPNMDEFLVDCYNACKGTDVILYSNLGFAAAHIAEKLKIPAISVPLQPIYRSHEFPALNLSPKKHFRKTYNWMTHMLAEQMFWQPLRSTLSKWRKESLGIGRAPFWGPFGILDRQKQMFLCGFSPLVFPRPTDWGEWVHVTGYWLNQENKNWTPDKKLEDFINGGKPPVVITLGTGWGDDPEEKLKICIEALNRTGNRGVIH